MRLNSLKPAEGSRQARRRVGRGIGSGLGKTAGRGHKGQKSRSGGFHKVGFEGGQMPLQRRLPKRGFTPLSVDDTAEVRLSELNKLAVEVIDLVALKAAGIVPSRARSAKVIKSGALAKAVKLQGVLATKGARAEIEAAGGSVEAPSPAPETKARKAAAAGKGKGKGGAQGGKPASAAGKPASAAGKPGSAAGKPGSAAGTPGPAAGNSGSAA